MSTSGSAINEAMINTLVAKSGSNVFNSASPNGNITMRDYGMLDTTQSGSVYFLLPPSFDSEQVAFGNPQEEAKVWTTKLTCYIKDDGSVTSVFNKIYQAEKDLDAGLIGDSDFGNAVLNFSMKHGGGWDGQTFIESNAGMAYIPVDFYIESMVQEY